MKRFFLITLAVLLCLSFASCGETNTAEPTAAETQPPTAAPYIDTPVEEPEWTLYEGELKLMNGEEMLAEGEDFLYFAIVGADPSEMELRFKLSDTAAQSLKTAEADNLSISFNGENIGKASLSEDCSVAAITSANAAEEITSLATKIRGLS